MPLNAQETTALEPDEEQRFQKWAKWNKLKDVDHPQSFYDYRGYWKSSGGIPVIEGQHFPDTYKQHGHPSFSVESKYSAGPHDGGHWMNDIYVPQAAASHVQTPQPMKPAGSLIGQLLGRTKS